MFALSSGRRNRILRYDTAIVFNIYIQFRMRKQPSPKLQDFGKAVRSEAMAEVVTDMRLKHDLFLFPRHAATVDEVFDDMSNFSHMGMRRDVIAIGQDKPRKRRGMFGERCLQFAEVHAHLYTCPGI